jgi:tRNA U38,U39,U40 pseudouridine synthase TruA
MRESDTHCQFRTENVWNYSKNDKSTALPLLVYWQNDFKSVYSLTLIRRLHTQLVGERNFVAFIAE